jgi:hypothetical protein
MTEEELKKNYPGIAHGYDFVLPSYAWMLTRMEAANTRIQSMQTFFSTFTFAVPAAAKALNPQLSFVAGRFLLAMTAFGVLMIVGILTGSRSAIMLAHPNLVYEKWLHWPEFEFKKNAISWAGEHFQYNISLLQKKARAASWMTALFLIELMFLLAWIATS